MYPMLKNMNQGLRKHVLGFAGKLIEIPSISQQEGAVADQVEATMKALEYDDVFRDDSGNVIGVLHGNESEPTVLLNSHMDTVQPIKELWEGDPYQPRIEGSRLFGLGTSDCKGGLAAQVYAGGLLKRSLLPLKGNLVVAATVSEANGLSVGVRALMEKTLPELGLKPAYAILGEPTDLNLYYGHDGWLDIELRVESENPFHVDDAAQAIYLDLDATAPSYGGDSDREVINLHKPFFQNTDRSRKATIRMRRRLAASDNAATILAQVRRHAAVVADRTATVALDVVAPEEPHQLYNGRTVSVQRITHAWATDPFHPLVDRARQALAAAGCAVNVGRWKLGRLGMGTCGGVLTREFGIPCIGYGPGNEAAAHAFNEYVDIEKLCEAVYGTASIVHGLIGIPIFGWTSDEI